jgi:hypothetical protein
MRSVFLCREIVDEKRYVQLITNVVEQEREYVPIKVSVPLKFRFYNGNL